MGSDPGFSEMNFNPSYMAGSYSAEASFNAIAEQLIVQTILEGSGGPDSNEMSEEGLRFIRYLLSISRSARFGFLPNFKDMNAVRNVARQFIRSCGGAASAMYTMHQILHDS